MFSLFTIVVTGAAISIASAFNNPAGVDIWCGKAYRATNASFNPGGFFIEPTKSSTPLLKFKTRPRMSLYLEGDLNASFLVDASLSELVGQPSYAMNETNHTGSMTELNIRVLINNSTELSLNSSSVVVGSSGNEISFELGEVPPSIVPYSVTFLGSLGRNDTQVFVSTTELLHLPRRTDGGSVTRLDNLHGGLSVLKRNETVWSLVFPYTYYVQWSLYWYANLSTLDDFASRGYNVIHIVPTGDLSDTPFPWDVLEPYINHADELGLYLQYDVRWDYTNLSTMTSQISHLHSHPSILLWYTADEPDGKSDPLNSTLIAYNTIRALDPYHPVSLALNCYDFYYEDYASGADIILSDVYPIAVNTSWSTEYSTPCNTTYGCCGCDDCLGVFEDVSDRLDNFARFDEVIGWSKTHWGAPQAFGNETFWTRHPSEEEEVVMTVLSVNHGAKGIVMWDFPTTEEIQGVTDSLAAVFTSGEVTGILLGGTLVGNLEVEGATRVDAAAWVGGGEKVLLSVVNMNYGDLEGNVSVALPVEVRAGSAVEMLWGIAQWTVEGKEIRTTGLQGLEVSLMMLELAQSGSVNE